MTENKRFTSSTYQNALSGVYDRKENLTVNECCNLLNELHEENKQLKKDVEYWKQVASQYNNELNVFEHCKKYKTECKDIHWSSD